MLDGLDEVREDLRIRVKQKIERFFQNWGTYPNRFIISCRIKALDYEFEKFTEVEIADFDEEQIVAFVEGWFKSRNDCQKAKLFINRLRSEKYKSVKDLAKTPLLLTLLCLVFSDSLSFPLNHSDLYEEGLDILLQTWDASRNIVRDEPDETYKKLLLRDKKNLLSQIAYSTFSTGSYIFSQQEVKCVIIDYIRSLPDTNPEVLVDEEVILKSILKSIVVQHGLLVERAKRIYSFSHLTFHEYYTAKYIVDHGTLQSSTSPLLIELMNHLTDLSWEEVFLRIAEISPRSEGLLELMKVRVDGLLAQDQELQKFLQWVKEKSESLWFRVGKKYKLAEIRANYLDFDIALDCDRSLGWLLNPSFTRAFTCASFLARARRCEVEDTFLEIPVGDLSGSHLEQAMAITSARTQAIKQLLNEVGLDSELGQQLQQLRTEQEQLEQLRTELEQSPVIDLAKTKLYEEKVQIWGDRLREVIVPYHSLGNNWRFDHFTDEQTNLLKKYYYANKLLVRCVDKSRVAQTVRKAIKETLLLPV